MAFNNSEHSKTVANYSFQQLRQTENCSPENCQRHGQGCYRQTPSSSPKARHQPQLGQLTRGIHCNQMTMSGYMVLDNLKQVASK